MINPNKFIGLKQQESMGSLTDPLQAEQDFLAKRMSQPVPVPGDQNQTMSPMMQQEKSKMQTVQNDPKLQEGSDASYGISGYVNTEKEYKQALQEKNHPNVYGSPAKQTDYPHAGTKYNYKKGELVDTDDFNESSFNSSRTGGSVSYPNIHTRDYSDVQEDSKGQYMTSLGSREFYGDEKRPTSSTHDDFLGNTVERDTIRPNTGKKFASTYLPSAKNRDEAFKKYRTNN